MSHSFHSTAVTASMALLLASLGGASANAASVNVGTALKDFNAIIFGNASTTSDIEGAAVIGGNFSGATVYNNPTAAQPAGFGALTVYGSTNGNPINMDNGGSAYVGGTHGAIINFNGGGGYIGAPGVTIADFETAFDSASAKLSTLTATSTLPAPGNNEVINATPGASGIAVFDITAADLAAIPSYNIALNGASTVIFNVSGDTIDFNGNDESGTTGADNIIWNFYQATKVTLGTELAGTVLAVQATVNNSNAIDGTLVAASWGGDGELHNYGFAGPLPAGVPEPSTWAMMLLGFGGMGAMLRRARVRRAAA